MQGDSIRVMLLVTDVLKKTKSGQLDLAYLRRLAKELAVQDLLERALQEA